ncbi:MAG: hypothetical protein M0030_10185 [Actinomycetota bacterium]|nr:hypothetical protein [Actinomycetota bacterium]
MNMPLNKLRRAARVPAGLVLAAGMTAALTGAASPAARPGVSRPSAFSTGGSLSAVAATSAGNAWAVGGRAGKTLILHWNGTAWKIVASPTPAGGAMLTGVAAISAGDAWAVGYNPTVGSHALILRWTGKVWRTSSTPAAEFLTSVTIASKTSVWVTGTTTHGKPLLLHWGGAMWRSVRVPTTADGDLWGVTALSATNVWAVGDTLGRPLILHWTGTAWRTVRPPAGWSGYSGYWRSVAGASARSVWAVTSSPCPSCSSTQGGIYRWNGSAWKLAGRTGAPSSADAGGLTAVAASSSTSAWAVGLTTPGSALIMHWNGTAWKIVKRLTGASHDFLAGVAALSAKNAWAVGTTGSGKTLILHWNGSTWR